MVRPYARYKIYKQEKNHTLSLRSLEKGEANIHINFIAIMIKQIYLTLKASILFLYKCSETREDSFAKEVTEHAFQGRH